MRKEKKNRIERTEQINIAKNKCMESAMEAALKCGNNHRLAARMRTDRDRLIKGKEGKERY